MCAHAKRDRVPCVCALETRARTRARALRARAELRAPLPQLDERPVETPRRGQREPYCGGERARAPGEGQAARARQLDAGCNCTTLTNKKVFAGLTQKQLVISAVVAGVVIGGGALLYVALR